MNPVRADIIARAIIAGKTQVQAVEEAGYSDNAGNASLICHRPQVLDRIEYHRNRLQKKMDITVFDLAEPLQRIINKENTKDCDVINAVKVLASIVGISNNSNSNNSITYNFTVVSQAAVDEHKQKILEGVIVHEQREPTDNSTTT